MIYLTIFVLLHTCVNIHYFLLLWLWQFISLCVKNTLFYSWLTFISNQQKPELQPHPSRPAPHNHPWRPLQTRLSNTNKLFLPQEWKVNSNFKPPSKVKSQKPDSEVILKGEPEAPTGEIMFHSTIPLWRLCLVLWVNVIVYLELGESSVDPYQLNINQWVKHCVSQRLKC